MLGGGSVIGGFAFGQGVTSSDPRVSPHPGEVRTLQTSRRETSLHFCQVDFSRGGRGELSHVSLSPLSAQTVLTTLIRCLMFAKGPAVSRISLGIGSVSRR